MTGIPDTKQANQLSVLCLAFLAGLVLMSPDTAHSQRNTGWCNYMDGRGAVPCEDGPPTTPAPEPFRERDRRSNDEFEEKPRRTPKVTPPRREEPIPDNVVRDGRGFRPRAGYGWVNPHKQSDLRVRPQPAGYRHPRYPYVWWDGVGSWYPLEGFEFLNPNSSDLRVRPLTRLTPHPRVPEVVAVGDGGWMAAEGFRLTPESTWEDPIAVPLPRGTRHPRLPNVVANGTGGWNPAEGFQFAPGATWDNPVAIALPSGTPHPWIKNIVADGIGRWVPAEGYMWADRNAFQIKPIPEGTPHARHPNVVWNGSGEMHPAGSYWWLNEGERTDKRVVRILATEADRKASILSDTPSLFVLWKSYGAVAEPRPWHQLEHMEQVTRHEARIEEAAARHRVDPDLIRAIIWLETTHGWYDEVTGKFKAPKSLRPMNVYVDVWVGFGVPREGLEDPALNIDTGTKLLARIIRRTHGQDIAGIASLYNDLRTQGVTTYGKTVEHYYRTKPWLLNRPI